MRPTSVNLTEQERMTAEAIRVTIRTARPRITVEKAAKDLGVSSDVLSNVMHGRTKPDANLVDRIRQKFQLPNYWPGNDNVRVTDSRTFSVSGTPLVPIRVLGNVSAGQGSSNVDIDNEMVYVPERLAQCGSLGWIVDGESMMPALEPGDTVLFRELRTPRRGYPFLLKSPSGELRVKILDWDKEWTLRSLNSDFAIEPLGHHELLGILVGWYRVRGTRETLDSDPGGLRLE
jgi:hypothetical protein